MIHLTQTELKIIDDAMNSGFITRNGLRLCVMREYRERCRLVGRPAVVLIRSVRHDRIESDGRLVDTVPAGQGIRRAKELAEVTTWTT